MLVNLGSCHPVRGAGTDESYALPSGSMHHSRTRSTLGRCTSGTWIYSPKRSAMGRGAMGVEVAMEGVEATAAAAAVMVVK